MLGTSGLVAVAVLAVGLNVADIARVVRQQGPMPGAEGLAIPAQAWTPLVEDPADRERDRNDAYLQRKAAEREREFQQQQRQQADDRRLPQDRTRTVETLKDRSKSLLQN